MASTHDESGGHETSLATTQSSSSDIPPSYFLGFRFSQSLWVNWNRLQTLEKWTELAIRPSTAEACHPADRHLFPSDPDHIDDIVALNRQCETVRSLLNQEISALNVETTEWEPYLVVRPSQIESAGLGLFFEGVDDNHVLPTGSILCYYAGHIHSHTSSRTLTDKSYLIWVCDDILVDPGPLPKIQARYINDPLNEDVINCRYVPDRKLKVRSAVVTTRPIFSGEELFVTYGEAYWNQQPIVGRPLNSSRDLKPHL
ncbi:hypothetical protein IV203_024150 [Nitzschia inconspicua]|uniref:SET domain-containing protein n=1 Tax=Nitzschia inconspicua TaxID=303405 RepID=A0A9K3KBA9_9STRA|nr:hypothetical protein IV203_024150 [Nitzschia inconspicua]